MKTRILILAALVITLSGCIRNNIDTDPEVTDFSNLIISDDFEFKSTENLEVNVQVMDNVQSVIEIYKGNPDEDGELLKKGITSDTYNFSTELVLPTHLKSIYILRKSIFGTIEKKEISIESDYLMATFGSNKKSVSTTNYLVEPGTWPECGSDCDYNVSASDNEIDPSANETWCIPAGVTFEGDLDFPSWGINYLIICGTATIEDVASGVGTIVVTSTGSLTFEDNYDPAWGSNFINYGTVVFKEASSWKTLEISGGEFENHGNFSGKEILLDNSSFFNNGTITLSEDFELNTCTGTNDGTLTADKKFKLLSGNDEFENFSNMTFGNDSYVYGTFNNYDGTVHFVQKFEVKGGSEFNNSCKLIVEHELKTVGDIENTGYIECDSEFEVTGGSELVMAEGSLVSTEDFRLYGDVTGPASSYCKIEILDRTKLEWGSEVTGKVDLCDADGTFETNNASLGSNVSYCANEVPSTDCIPGNGVSIQDADNDGTPDSLDEYPNDPDKAFNSYYPNENDFASLAFEDLWPGLGDYDFNDFVIDFQYKLVTNTNNQFTQIVAKFDIKAVGATLENGFGVSFDIPSSAVSSVTGCEINGNLISLASNGVENGHTNKTVVIIYDDILAFTNNGSMINTDPSGSVIDFSVTTVTINLNTPQVSIGTEPFNPFIFIDQDRGREVHLVNKEPTALANQQYFGQDHDNSGNGSYYKTQNNYPWAIEIPEEFDYPYEKVDIVSSYLKFGTWAESNGVSYDNWYQNEPGYRIVLNIHLN